MRTSAAFSDVSGSQKRVGLYMAFFSRKFVAAAAAATPRVVVPAPSIVDCRNRRRSIRPPRCASVVGSSVRPGVSCWTIGRKVAKITTQRPGHWTMRRRVLDLNDFFYFVQVVDRGGFTAAGRTLRIPKSTLSHRIQQLETNLGVRLLNRTSRRFGVTDAGGEFYRHAVTMLRAAELAETAIRHRLNDRPAPCAAPWLWPPCSSQCPVSW